MRGSTAAAWLWPASPGDEKEVMGMTWQRSDVLATLEDKASVGEARSAFR
ncbi:MAG: hypothetical protein IIC82_07440 [Chloroflexi bacterium]|nr:hypothetical protein [Chloroflexota bacterium]